MDGEPEEIEFDFDKYKREYEDNIAELADSNLEGDEESEDRTVN